MLTPVATINSANISNLATSPTDTVTKHLSSDSLLAKLKFNFRLWLFRHKNIQRHFRGLRYMLHAVEKMKLETPLFNIADIPVLKTNLHPLFCNSGSGVTASVAASVAVLKKNAFVYGPMLNADAVRNLINRYVPELARGYRNAYLQDQLLFDICHNDAILSVVREYFGFEPTLHSCCVAVDIPGEKITDNAYQEGFHYDIAGIKSLNVFIYLTDVDGSSLPHVVIKGSHRGKRVRDLYKGYLTSGDAKKLYGDAITTLTGSAGTVIFENTEAFHRRGELGEKGRVFVNILYTAGNKNLM